MAVQAQLPDFRNRSNQSLHLNHLVHRYDLVVSETATSDPRSELTYNCNVSGSRRRGRDQEPPAAMAYPHQNAGTPVRLPARLMESAGASTSCLVPELYAHLHHQNLEIDAIVLFHVFQDR